MTIDELITWLTEARDRLPATNGDSEVVVSVAFAYDFPADLEKWAGLPVIGATTALNGRAVLTVMARADGFNP